MKKYQFLYSATLKLT